MARRFGAIPALSDLAQDIANGAPPELVLSWADSDRSAACAARLLAPYRLEGTVAASDTVGLSRMTQEHDLFAVLQMVSRPKEVIHALGRAIGGEPIGRWIADNSEMFYDRAIPVDEVLGAMLEVHRRLPATGPAIGICIHRGLFYHIGGGLYGEDADLVECVAEKKTRGGETLLTQRGWEALREPDRFRAQPYFEFSGEPIFSVTEGPSFADLPLTDTAYPAPYSDDFVDALLQAASPADVCQYQREQTLLLVERCPRAGQRGEAALLDDLLGNALLDVVFRQVARKHGVTTLKTSGRLALAALDAPVIALEMAKSIRHTLQKSRITIRAGIDRGPLFVFPMAKGRWEFAGDPVNVASKLAEDCGDPGRIYLTVRAAEGIVLRRARSRHWQRSALDLYAWEV